jgi:MoxR-like ATPase
MACQETVRKVLVPDHVMDFVLDVVRKTRPKDPGVPAFVKELVAGAPARAPASSGCWAARSARSCRAAST